MLVCHPACVFSGSRMPQFKLDQRIQLVCPIMVSFWRLTTAQRHPGIELFVKMAGIARS